MIQKPMRPNEIDMFFKSVTSINGIGPKVADLIARVTGRESRDETKIVDLIYHVPSSLIDRQIGPGVSHMVDGAVSTVRVTVDSHQAPPRGRGNIPYRVFAHDETGEISFVFFKAHQSWLEKSLPEGEKVIVSGKASWFNGQASMVHPDFMMAEDKAKDMPRYETVYPLTAGLSLKILKKGINEAVSTLPDLPDWIDKELAKKHSFPSYKDALDQIHHPRDMADMEPQAPARRRLAYDEFLAGQLSLALVRQSIRKLPGDPLHVKGNLRRKIVDALPFSLTNSQNDAIQDILLDMNKDERMLRLLQGDVGAGKTIVALAAMADAVEAGGQAVLMAPTEILARQHHASLSKMAEAAGISIDILVGKSKAAERREVLERIEDGRAQIIVGTHALFQDAVIYKKLLVAVVDEQHRFGVHQRLRLTAKGVAPHMLVMTATPIPRTLVLSAFGDMDVSKLTEKPAGRKPISTVSIDRDRLPQMVDRLRVATADGKKAYWICPLVEDSELSDLTSAEARAEELQRALPDVPVGLVHGRMKGDEKDDAMEAFKRGDTRILVATTVIEVGVDVPDATIIVIEHAERFGLAQLHQLRGRVGRGDEASSCVLLFKSPLSETAQARLNILRETEDGFRIAEEDLRLRGEGELLGTRQSGTPGFRIAQLDAHSDLLEIARNDARYIIETDASLTSERGKAIKMLLYLMRRDEAIRFIRAG
jgi:ATP-dependent DNA helicase RecG